MRTFIGTAVAVVAAMILFTGPASAKWTCDGPAYVSFDIDGIDPSQAPGTGTPEIGGYTTYTAQRMIRHLSGLDIVGADLVEVSPPFDLGGMTSWVGVNIMFELMCPLAQAVAKRRGRAMS